MREIGRRAYLLGVFFLGLLGTMALSVPDAGARATRCRDLETRSSAEFLAAGTFAWGQRTFSFEDGSRPTPANGTFAGAPSRRLTTEVWYPALPPGGPGAALDPAGAPYPVILYSHGFRGFRTSEFHLTRHLASRGYVVVAPDFPLSSFFAPGGSTVDDTANQPGDLTVVLDALLAVSADPSGPLPNAVDPERVGASGLSLGGLTTLLATFHPDLREPRIKAALAMAAPACFFGRRFFRTARVPLLLMHGDSDLLVPFAENARRAFKVARRRQLVTIKNGSHTGFTALAAGADQSTHLDLAIGCAAVEGIANDPSSPGDVIIPGLGSRKQGIVVKPGRCPAPCQDTEEIAGPALDATRHHELAKTALAAFFDAHLKGNASAACFLRRGLERENADLVVQGR